MRNKLVRKIKLHSKSRELKSDWGSPGRWKQIPWLNVSGLWLEQAGFRAGDAVEIMVEHNTLTIKNCSHGDSHH